MRHQEAFRKLNLAPNFHLQVYPLTGEAVHEKKVTVWELNNNEDDSAGGVTGWDRMD